MKLTAKQCQNAQPTGKRQRLGDGGGLYLPIGPRGGKSWIQRIRILGQRTDIGLGSHELVSLATAQKQALANRVAAFEGRDPREQQARPTGEGTTFAEAAEAYMQEHGFGWANPTKKGWQQSLEQHVFPHIGDMNVADVDLPDIKKVLLPLANTKAVVSNVARRISAVLVWAIVAGHREKADRTSMVFQSLPKRKAEQKSHASIPHTDVRAAIEAVNGAKVMDSFKLAFGLLCLTACRTSEVLGCEWSEIDIDSATWTIGAERSKTRKPHRVALSKQAIILLKSCKRRVNSNLVFCGLKGKLSDKSIRNALRAGGVAASGHGFRTSFSDWCRETGVQADVRESALAHQVAANSVKKSYTI